MERHDDQSTGLFTVASRQHSESDEFDALHVRRLHVLVQFFQVGLAELCDVFPFDEAKKFNRMQEKLYKTKIRNTNKQLLLVIEYQKQQQINQSINRSVNGSDHGLHNQSINRPYEFTNLSISS